MKFKNIQAGDEVLIPVRGYIYRGYGRYKTFLVKRCVERITKTQFVVDGANYKKECGKKIGGDYFECAKQIGEQLSLNSDDIAKDETTDYEVFKCELNIITSAVKKAEDTLSLINSAKSHESALKHAMEFIELTHSNEK